MIMCSLSSFYSEKIIGVLKLFEYFCKIQDNKTLNFDFDSIA